MGEMSQGLLPSFVKLLYSIGKHEVTGIMLQFDTVSGKIAIDTEFSRKNEKIVITRGMDGVRVQYIKPGTHLTSEPRRLPIFRWSVKAVFSRILQFS